MWMEGRKEQEGGVEEGREYRGKERERLKLLIKVDSLTLCTQRIGSSSSKSCFV